MSGIKAGVAKFGPVVADVEEMTVLGALRLPDLDISVVSGSGTCPTPAAPVGSP